jgi:hypothetical protein
MQRLDNKCKWEITTLQKSKEKGLLNFSLLSGKKLILINVLYVPEIRKNLVSANLLCKKGDTKQNDKHDMHVSR